MSSDRGAVVVERRLQLLHGEKVPIYHPPGGTVCLQRATEASFITQRTRTDCYTISLLLGRPTELSRLLLMDNSIIILPVFSRSCCYTVWSAIAIIMSSVRLSVTLCTVVHCGSQGQCTGNRAKSCTSVFLAGKLLYKLICLFSHFCCRISFNHKMHRKNELKKTRTWVLWDAQNHTCIG